jgi:hypothetical protein
MITSLLAMRKRTCHALIEDGKELSLEKRSGRETDGLFGRGSQSLLDISASNRLWRE